MHGIDLLKNFMKLVYDIDEKTATGSEHTISYVRSKVDVGFGKVSVNFFEKIKFQNFKIYMGMMLH